MATLIITEDYPFRSGGISVYCYQLAKHLVSSGEEVLVLAPHTEKDAELDKKETYSVFRIRLFHNRWIRLFSRIGYSLLIAGKYKVRKIYTTHWFPSGLVAVIAGTLFNIPFFLATHGAEVTVPVGVIHRLIRNTVIKRATGIFSCSEFTKNVVIGFGVSAQKVAYIPYGVDIERFYPDAGFRKTVRDKYGLEGKRVLLTVARIAWHKGHDMVIKSLPRVLNTFPDAVYMIAGGDHGEKKRLEELIRGLGLEKYVIFIGDVPFFGPDLPMVYNACDLFIMVSRVIRNFVDVEGFGIVYAEAAACGKPLIGGRTGGIGSAVIDGITGLLVDPLSREEISQAIIRIFKDREFADYLGSNAKKRAVEELSWPKLIERTKRFSDSLSPSRKPSYR